MLITSTADPFVIGGKTFHSRLIVGTGKYRTSAEMQEALDASGAEIVTVAIRRLDLDDPNQRTILNDIDWKHFTFLPNTAGARNADEAVRIARLGRALGLSDLPFVKVEVVPDERYLLPDPVETFEACRTLVNEGFIVLPYIHADPVLARRLAQLGTATVMPLGSPIGSGQGIVNAEAIRIIVEQATVPVVVDAGIGGAADAAMAMELGADACLVNTAIARAKNPAAMAEAIRLGVEGGRKSFLAGRIPRLPYASASSPADGVLR